MSTTASVGRTPLAHPRASRRVTLLAAAGAALCPLVYGNSAHAQTAPQVSLGEPELTDSWASPHRWLLGEGDQAKPFNRTDGMDEMPGSNNGLFFSAKANTHLNLTPPALEEGYAVGDLRASARFGYVMFSSRNSAQISYGGIDASGYTPKVSSKDQLTFRAWNLDMHVTGQTADDSTHWEFGADTTGDVLAKVTVDPLFGYENGLAFQAYQQKAQAKDAAAATAHKKAPKAAAFVAPNDFFTPAAVAAAQGEVYAGYDHRTSIGTFRMSATAGIFAQGMHVGPMDDTDPAISPRITFSQSWQSLDDKWALGVSEQARLGGPKRVAVSATRTLTHDLYLTATAGMMSGYDDTNLETHVRGHVAESKWVGLGLVWRIGKD